MKLFLFTRMNSETKRFETLLFWDPLYIDIKNLAYDGYYYESHYLNCAFCDLRIQEFKAIAMIKDFVNLHDFYSITCLQYKHNNNIKMNNYYTLIFE